MTNSKKSNTEKCAFCEFCEKGDILETKEEEEMYGKHMETTHEMTK